MPKQKKWDERWPGGFQATFSMRHLAKENHSRLVMLTDVKRKRGEDVSMEWLINEAIEEYCGRYWLEMIGELPDVE